MELILKKLEDWLETLDKLLLLLAFTASAYWTVFKLAPSIYIPVLAVEGYVGSYIEKLEDCMETLDQLLLLLAFTASSLLKLAPSIYLILLAVEGDVAHSGINNIYEDVLERVQCTKTALVSTLFIIFL